MLILFPRLIIWFFCDQVSTLRREGTTCIRILILNYLFNSLPEGLIPDIAALFREHEYTASSQPHFPISQTQKLDLHKNMISHSWNLPSSSQLYCISHTYFSHHLCLTYWKITVFLILPKNTPIPFYTIKINIGSSQETHTLYQILRSIKVCILWLYKSSLFIFLQTKILIFSYYQINPHFYWSSNSKFKFCF